MGKELVPKWKRGPVGLFGTAPGWKGSLEFRRFPPDRPDFIVLGALYKVIPVSAEEGAPPGPTRFVELG